MITLEHQNEKILNSGYKKRYNRFINFLKNKNLIELQNKYNTFEICIISEINKRTKLKSKKSFWIGNKNIDLFFYQIKSKSHKGFAGLAIESNGPIHNLEAKMGKDNIKENLLASIGIITLSIDTNDKNFLISKIFKELRHFNRLDTRGRQRLLKKIYIITILFNSNDSELKKFCGNY